MSVLTKEYTISFDATKVVELDVGVLGLPGLFVSDRGTNCGNRNSVTLVKDNLGAALTTPETNIFSLTNNAVDKFI